MKEFIDSIKTLKATIAELSKSEELTQDQLEQLNKAVASLRRHREKKEKAKDMKAQEAQRDQYRNIGKQINEAMRTGVSAEGSLEDKPKKKSNLRLVKALEDAGHRTSALLLKNWGEMDHIAKDMAKDLPNDLNKALFPDDESNMVSPAKEIPPTKERTQEQIRHAISMLKDMKDYRWVITDEVPGAKKIMEKEFARLKREIDTYIKQHAKAKK